MTLNDLPLISGLIERMHFLSARSSVIAENIANADTPGYVAKDIANPNFSSMVANTPSQTMRTSEARHISSSNSTVITNGAKPSRDAVASLNDNTVSVETETMKLAQTRMDYGLASTVYRKSLNMIRLAVSSNR